MAVDHTGFVGVVGVGGGGGRVGSGVGHGWMGLDVQCSTGMGRWLVDELGKRSWWLSVIYSSSNDVIECLQSTVKLKGAHGLYLVNYTYDKSWFLGLVGYGVALTDIYLNGQGPEFNPQRNQVFWCIFAQFGAS